MTRPEKIEAIYDNYPDMVNSDKDLILYWWSREGLVLTDKQQEIFNSNCTAPEFITRDARKVRADESNNHKASKVIEEAREENMREQSYNAVHKTPQYSTYEDSNGNTFINLSEEQSCT